MGIGDSAGLLFRIKADNDDATKKIAQTRGDITTLGAASSTTGAAMAGPLAAGAVVAGAAITALATYAATAAIELFNLTKASAEYGSTIFDASQKTGLSAETISALGFAAKASGSSLEQITSSVAKFNVLLGQAQLENSKADKTLTAFGITARDTDTALAQALQTLADTTDANKQAAIAATLFKDKTGDVLNTVREFKGDLPGLIDRLDDLGALMSGQNARAADQFTDTLDTLGAQAKNLAADFTLAFAPEIVRAMDAVSQALANNKEVVRDWGTYVAEVLRGLQQSFAFYFSDTALGFYKWGSDIVNALDPPIIGLTRILSLLQQIGAASRATDSLKGLVGGTALGGGTFDIGAGGGGARGGGGRAPKDNSDALARKAEQERAAAVKAAEAAVRDRLEIYANGDKERQAQLEQALSLGLISEKEKISEASRFRQLAVIRERQALEGLLANDKITLNEEERVDILQQLKVLTIALRVEKLKGGTQITEQIKKETEEENKLLEKEKERLDVLRKISDEKKKRAQQAVIDNDREAQAQLRSEKDAVMRLGGGGGATTQSLIDGFKDNQVAVASIETLRAAFSALGEAIGTVVQAWVLYGNAGTSVKKVTAQILAGIAQQASVKAIFELAEGFAALAKAFFGIPNAGPSAAMHFKSAAIYGSIAGIAAVAGRGVAGNSFNQQAGASTGGGGGGSGGGQNGQEQQNNLTTRFNGFGEDEGRRSGIAGMVQIWRDEARANRQVMGQLEVTTHALASRITGMSPGDVVTVGAADAGRAIQRAVVSEFADNFGSTGEYERNMGRAR
jgi:hypothetical protein